MLDSKLRPTRAVLRGVNKINDFHKIVTSYNNFVSNPFEYSNCALTRAGCKDVTYVSNEAYFSSNFLSCLLCRQRQIMQFYDSQSANFEKFSDPFNHKYTVYESIPLL